MTAEELPDFPLDDATLLAVEHAIGGVLSAEPEHGGSLDEPVRIGAEYGLAELLDFLAGVTEPDPERCYRIDGDGERMTPEQAARDDALGLDQVWLDERPHYCEHDVIRALIAEVRRLRLTGDGGVATPWLTGVALGVLKARGVVRIRIGEGRDWYLIHAHLNEDDEPVLGLDDVLLLLQAEEVES